MNLDFSNKNIAKIIAEMNTKAVGSRKYKVYEDRLKKHVKQIVRIRRARIPVNSNHIFFMISNIKPERIPLMYKRLIIKEKYKY